MRWKSYHLRKASGRRELLSDLEESQSAPSIFSNLQQLLTSQGYSTNGIDGIFGSGTDRAVRLFQKTHHLSVDGIVGANTYKALQQR